MFVLRYAIESPLDFLQGGCRQVGGDEREWEGMGGEMGSGCGRLED